MKTLKPQYPAPKLSPKLQAKLSKIKMLVLDVDGVLTDCKTFLDTDGEWRRSFCIRDGYGIVRLIEAGYKTAIITASKAKDIKDRAQVLGIHYFYEGNLDKHAAFLKLLKETNLIADEVAYVGDDLFDIPVLEKVGFAGTVPEAVPEVFEVVQYVTARLGGSGAVREVCELIIKYGALSK